MLSREENELVTRVENGAPAGRMMERYWLPALLADEVVEPGGTPVRVKLVGRQFVALRDGSGNLAIGDGVRAYPVREGGGVVWTYLGPAEFEPPFPALDFTALPRNQLAPVKFVEHANYLQAAEGAIDTAHSWFLHRGTVKDWKHRTGISLDHAPRLEAEDTAYGFRYAAIRTPVKDPETTKYVRVTNVVLPITVLVPRSLDPGTKPLVQMFVPMDDRTTMHYSIFFNPYEPIDEKLTREEMFCVPGVHIDENYEFEINEANWWNQDRVAMKGESYTGIDGFPRQDVACQESMGAIVDRTQEHLGTSDVAIIRMRRRLLENIRGIMAGREPIGADPGIDYPHLRSEQRIIGIDEPWQVVGAFAGEYAPAGA
jgi:phthalate 4,5-dioxygenase oxygenase subunit